MLKYLLFSFVFDCDFDSEDNEWKRPCDAKESKTQGSESELKFISQRSYARRCAWQVRKLLTQTARQANGWHVLCIESCAFGALVLGCLYSIQYKFNMLDHSLNTGRMINEQSE